MKPTPFHLTLTISVILSMSSAALAQTSPPVKQGSVPQGEHTPPPPPPAASEKPNPERMVQARQQICNMIMDAYNKEMTMVMPYDARTPHNGIMVTIKRHGTLERLLSLSWQAGCDIREFLKMEIVRINTDYQAGLLAQQKMQAGNPPQNTQQPAIQPAQ